MKYVRIVLGVLIGLYSLMGLWHMAVTVGHKTGLYAASSDMMVRMAPLMDAIAWWQVAVWLAALGFMLVAAWRLVRGGKAFVPYVVGLVIDFLGWMTIQGSDAYQTVFSAAERQFDYYIFGALVIVAAIIWWTEREPSPTAAAA